MIARHVLEHVEEPEKLLENIHDNGLSKGGALLLKLPNYGSWESDFFGKYWDNLDLHKHRHHFSKAGIEKLLLKKGFTNIKIREEIVPSSIARSLLFVRDHGPVPLKSVLKFYPMIPQGIRLAFSQAVGMLCFPLQAGRMIVTASTS